MIMIIMIIIMTTCAVEEDLVRPAPEGRAARQRLQGPRPLAPLLSLSLVFSLS